MRNRNQPSLKTKTGKQEQERARKHLEAVARNMNWQALTPLEQLAELDQRLGRGMGARKQRKRISEQIAQQLTGKMK